MDCGANQRYMEISIAQETLSSDYWEHIRWQLLREFMRTWWENGLVPAAEKDVTYVSLLRDEPEAPKLTS